MCTDIRFVRDKMVAKTKPVPCKAYEYYEPSMIAILLYMYIIIINQSIYPTYNRIMKELTKLIIQILTYDEVYSCPNRMQYHKQRVMYLCKYVYT